MYSLRRKICAAMFAALALWPASPAGAQSLPPFVSRLTAQADGSTVRLTWYDADGDVVTYRVYRHTDEITANTLDEATAVAEVEPGVMELTETLSEPGSYYYAVIGVDTSGNEYTPLVDYRNKTTKAVEVTVETTPRYEPVRVTDIQAQTSDDSVVLRFDTSKPGGELIIYRSTTRPERLSDLVNAILLDTVSASTRQYTDYPIAGVPYYYGVFDAVQIQVGSAEFEKGANVLAEAVEIPLETAAIDTPRIQVRRVRPLPFLVLSSAIDTGQTLSPSRARTEPAATPLKADTRDALEHLLDHSPEPSRQEPSLEVLPIDRSGGDGSAPTGLRTAIAGAIEQKEWAVAVEALNDFLRIRRDPRVTSRAHFYLGQCRYQQGNYREAFLNFLFAMEHYYSRSQPWITAILHKLQTS